MAKEGKPSPARSEPGLRRDRERTARLSDALRDNLLKRKAQQRARTAGKEAAQPPARRKP